MKTRTIKNMQKNFREKSHQETYFLLFTVKLQFPHCGDSPRWPTPGYLPCAWRGGGLWSCSRDRAAASIRQQFSPFRPGKNLSIHRCGSTIAYRRLPAIARLFWGAITASFWKLRAKIKLKKPIMNMNTRSASSLWYRLSHKHTLTHTQLWHSYRHTNV